MPTTGKLKQEIADAERGWRRSAVGPAAAKPEIAYEKAGDRKKRAHRLITRGAAGRKHRTAGKGFERNGVLCFTEKVFTLPEVRALLMEAVNAQIRQARKERDKYRTYFTSMLHRSKRSAGQSAVASAAYRSGESCTASITERTVTTPGKAASLVLKSCCRPIALLLLRRQANSVERGGKGRTGQESPACIQFRHCLAERVFHAGEHRPCKAILLEQFVSRGMVVDFSVHAPDKEDGSIANPHFHVMCPIRPLLPGRKNGATSSGGNISLDENGERIQG